MSNQALEGQGYTREEVRDALHSDSRVMRYRYDLLNSSNDLKGELDGVIIGGSITHNTFADIKRTARFTIDPKLAGDVDWLSDRVRPWVGVEMPDGGVREWPQGVFLMSTPKLQYRSGYSTREVEAYDQSLVLRNYKYRRRVTMVSTRTISDLLANVISMPADIKESSKSLDKNRSFPPGTSRWEVAADLIDKAGYKSLYFDGNGIAHVEDYVSPSDETPGYAYRTDEKSVISPEFEDEFDLFEVANHWVLVVSQPDKPTLIATVLNENPDSPTSTVRRGQVITDFRTEEDSLDQQALEAKARRLAIEASQVFRHVKFPTLAMPFHGDADVYEVEYTPTGVQEKFGETAWELPLQSGNYMSHEMRRVVNLES